MSMTLTGVYLRVIPAVYDSGLSVYDTDRCLCVIPYVYDSDSCLAESHTRGL